MRQRLLVIDDDESLMRAYKEHFTQRGYKVDCAREMEEAQTLLAHFEYGAVLVDLRLSKLGFDGLSLVKYVHDLALSTRVVVLTGYGWPEIKAEAQAQGIDAFVQKPATLAQLSRTISELTGGEA